MKVGALEADLFEQCVQMSAGQSKVLPHCSLHLEIEQGLNPTGTMK